MSHLMNIYIRCGLWLALLLPVGRALAQDTIFTRSQPPLLVRVLEIAENEVRYKNFYNPDGVIRAVKSSDITRIVYENGKTEARFNRPDTGKPVPVVRTGPDVFKLEGRNLLYNNDDITYKAAFKIMLKRDPAKNSDEMNESLINAERNKNRQITFMLLGPACLIGGAYLARYNYYGPNDAPKAKRTLLTGVGLFVGCEAISMICKSVKNKHIRHAAELYNIEP
ncbi:MAG: hypothetical protein JST26_09815 [Bacteroidetes bacterium]|nr:hypothetical protein [Bacteroidota bacterium]